MLGSNSGSIGSINTITRNGVAEQFNTFVELYKVNATLLSGAFIQDEQLVQGSNTSFLFTVVGNSNNIVMYISNIVGGAPVVGQQVVGANSGAQANITAAFVPDLIFGSSDILYLENISPVTRANNQEETFKIIFNF